MLSIKEKIEEDVRVTSLARINLRITELLDLGVEIASSDAKTKSEILDVINSRASIYKNIIKDRF